jgi:predicted RNA-binding protein
VRELVKPGDVVIFYVAKKNSKRLGGKFVGAYRIASEWFREDKPLWPDEAREGRVKYPWRTRLEPVKLGVADYSELAPRLSFVVDKKRPGAPLIGTPGNYKRPIPRQDAELIINSLK